MTKAAALLAFFSDFGLEAYAASAVPDDVIFPYLTYEVVSGMYGDYERGITVNAYWYTDSEAIPNAWVEQLSAALSNGGTLLPCDSGYIWVKRGVPFAQAIRDDSNSAIKRRYINISLEFLTNH